MEDQDQKIIQNYDRRLQSDRSNVTREYLRYMQDRFGGLSAEKLSPSLLNFSLSVGLKVRESFEPQDKQLAVRIFSLVLKHSNCDDLEQLNVHAVIFEHVFKDAYYMDEITVTAEVWNCLILCLDHFTELDSFAWNECDEMLQRLIQNVNLAPNAHISICLLQFITRLGYHFTINRKEIEAHLSLDPSQEDNLSACREMSATINAVTSYRWAKSILEMFIVVSDKLLQSVEICDKMLCEMHLCYLVCILHIPLQVLHMHLNEFLTKFVAILCECLVVHKKSKKITKLVYQFVDTFTFQLDKDGLPSNLQEFPEALKSLRDHISRCR